MSVKNGHPREPDDPQGDAEARAELVSLAADDPQRLAMAKTPAANPAEREALGREWAFSDRLRRELAEVRVPATLEMTLRTLPEAVSPGEGASGDVAAGGTVPAVAARKAKPGFKLDWRAVAALLVIGAIVAGIVYYNQPLERVRLEATVSNTIAQIALTTYKKQAALPPEFATSDLAEAERLLAARGEYDVPLMMLKPDEANGPVAFRGAGTCDFGGVQAIYTRWERGGVKYTLYEFNGKKKGVAPLFHPVPLGDPAEGSSLQVYVFPGKAGKCCWALVMEGAGAENVFAKYGYDYGT